jgi:RNA polymerase sigma-32 factor
MKIANKPSYFANYFRGVERLPLLSREQELVLARRFKYAEDRKAADTLARAHLRLVVATAFRYQRYGVPLPELVAEGNLGLVHALDKFDPERGVRLVTYALHWIRSYILSYVIKSKSLVSGPGPLRSTLFFKARRELARGLSLFGEGEAAARWTAERLGVTPDELGLIAQRLEARDVSLEGGTTRHAGRERLIERLPATDDQEQRLFEHQVAGGVEAAVRSAIAELDPRERYIATHRLMVDASEELSLAEIGRVLGVSRERARQLESRTKRKLRVRVPALGDAAAREWLAERADQSLTPSS